jgi:hypothetical protein
MNYDFSKVNEQFFVSTKLILEKLSEIEIYEKYLGRIINTNTFYHSPFKVEKTPSFKFYVKNGQLIYKCFSSGNQGNCFSFVSELFNLTFQEALQKIAVDFKLNNSVNNSKTKKIIPLEQIFSPKDPVKIDIILREFTQSDLNYWSQFYINKNLLDLYDIKCADEVWVNGKLYWKYKDYNPIFRYRFGERVKCYRPLEKNKKKKWLSNTKAIDIQGFNQLPQKGELLFITSSMKDVLTLKVMGYNAIAPQAESNYLDIKMIKYLYTRFKKIIIFYDSDTDGLDLAKKRSMETGLEYIFIPLMFNCKDPSDFMREYGIEFCKEVIESSIK